MVVHCPVSKVNILCAGQMRAGVTSPTLLTSLQQASAAGTPAGVTAAPMSTIRLTMPQQTRQRSPAVAGTPATPQMSTQVLKVMGSQPGSIPQIITLSSPRAVLTHAACRRCFLIHNSDITLT